MRGPRSHSRFFVRRLFAPLLASAALACTESTAPDIRPNRAATSSKAASPAPQRTDLGAVEQELLAMANAKYPQYQPTAESFHGKLKASRAEDLSVLLRGDRCYRLVALARPEVPPSSATTTGRSPDLDLLLFDPSNTLIAVDGTVGIFAELGGPDPLCPSAATTFRAQLTHRDCDASYAFMVLEPIVR